MSWDVATSGSYADTAYSNGGAITFVTKTGRIEVLNPELNSFVSSGTLYNRYGDRFDDVRYYTGDSAS